MDSGFRFALIRYSNSGLVYNFCKISYWIFPEFIEERRAINGSNFAVSFHWEIDKNYVLAVKEGKLIIKVTVGFLTALSCLQIALCKGIHSVDSGFRVIDSRSLCQWNLDSGFQSLAGLRISWAGLQIPQAKIFSDSYLTWGNTKYIERVVAFPKINRSI